MHLVFVYGTLKSGRGNNHFLAGCNFETAEAPGIDLHCDGYLPFAKTGTGIACGEVYEVNDDILARLDRLEGHPYFYYRRKIKVLCGPKKKKKSAWIYLNKNAAKYPKIQNGKYL